MLARMFQRTQIACPCARIYQFRSPWHGDDEALEATAAGAVAWQIFIPSANRRHLLVGHSLKLQIRRKVPRDQIIPTSRITNLIYRTPHFSPHTHRRPKPKYASKSPRPLTLKPLCPPWPLEAAHRRLRGPALPLCSGPGLPVVGGLSRLKERGEGF